MNRPRLKMATRSAFRRASRQRAAEKDWVRKVEWIMRDVEPELMAGVHVRLRLRRPWRVVHP